MQQGVLADANDRESLLGDKAATDAELSKFQVDVQAETDPIQASLDDKLKRAKPPWQGACQAAWLREDSWASIAVDIWR